MTTTSSVRQKDIAAKAGVSQAAVSLALSGEPLSLRVKPETRKRIEEVARELNYLPNIPAQQLRGGRSGVLGILVGSTIAPGFSDRVAAMEETAIKRGYRIMVGQIGSTPDQVRQNIDDFAGRGLDGVICMSHERAEDASAISEALSRIEHVVYVQAPVTGEGNYIHFDSRACVQKAIDHLVATGRQRIGMVNLDESFQAYRDRREGYVESITNYGLRLDEELIWSDDGTRLAKPHEPSSEEVDRVVEHLVFRKKADAIIALSDDWAAQLIKAIRRRGLHAPRDVAVLGQGNSRIASYFDPEITTLDPQNKAIAESAIALLAEIIEGGNSPSRPVTIGPKLIVRQSG